MCFLFFFKQKTAYEMRISDWSSDVCSSDLCNSPGFLPRQEGGPQSVQSRNEPVGSQARLCALRRLVEFDPKRRSCVSARRGADDRQSRCFRLCLLKRRSQLLHQGHPVSRSSPTKLPVNLYGAANGCWERSDR